MAERSIYQVIRTEVKGQLNHLVELVGMEPAIRVSTPVSVEEAKTGLSEALAEHGFHVVHETDVQGIHEHYNLEYPEFEILKVARAESLRDCPMANGALAIDSGTSVFLPPSVIVYELDGETRVSAIRPSTLLALFTDADLQDTMRELEGVLWNALTEGVPEAELLSEEPPLPPGANRLRTEIKKRLNPLLTLVDAEYSIRVTTTLPRHEAEEALRDSLARRGQHVLGEVEARDARILLAVNPGQAHKALAIEPDIGVFAPLSVGVYAQGGRTHARAVRPSTLLIFFTDPDLRDVLLEMEMLLWNALVDLPDVEVLSRQPPLPPGTGQRTTAAGLPGGLGSVRKYRPQ
jgi:uncharacterized protein (DUF302 family)